MSNLGKILLLNIVIKDEYNSYSSPFNDYITMNNLLEELCDECKLHILQTSFHKFKPFGLTILKLLSESHISIHTFPEKNSATIDIYSCRDDFSEKNVIGIVKKYLDVERIVSSSHIRNII